MSSAELNKNKKIRTMETVVQLVRHLDGISFPENYRILSKVIGVDSGEIQRHFYNLNDVFCYQWIEQMTILVQKLRMS